MHLGQVHVGIRVSVLGHPVTWCSPESRICIMMPLQETRPNLTFATPFNPVLLSTTMNNKSPKRQNSKPRPDAVLRKPVFIFGETRRISRRPSQKLGQDTIPFK